MQDSCKKKIIQFLRCCLKIWDLICCNLLSVTTAICSSFNFYFKYFFYSYFKYFFDSYFKYFFDSYFEYFFNSYLVLVNFLTGSAKQQISNPLDWTSRKVELSLREILFYALLPRWLLCQDCNSPCGKITIKSKWCQKWGRKDQEEGIQNVFLEEPVIFCEYLFHVKNSCEDGCAVLFRGGFILCLGCL